MFRSLSVIFRKSRNVTKTCIETCMDNFNISAYVGFIIWIVCRRMDVNNIYDNSILIISSFLPQLLSKNQNPPSLVTMLLLLMNIVHIYDQISFGKYRIFRLIRLIFFHKKRVSKTHPVPLALKSARNILLVKDKNIKTVKNNLFILVVAKWDPNC